MSSRPYLLAAVLLAAALASAAGCAAVAQRGAVAPASSSQPTATAAPAPPVALSGPNEGSFMLRAPRMPPDRCLSDAGARLDIWCKPLPEGALARLGRVREGRGHGSSSSSDGDAAADQPDPGCHEESISSVALSADGELVATAADDGVRLWQSRSGRPLLRLLLPPKCETRSAVATFSPDSRQLVGAGGCALRRYDIAARRSLAPIAFRAITPSADGSSAAQHDEADGGTDAAADDELSGPVCDVPLGIALSPRGELAVVTTSRGLLRRFDLSANRELRPVHITEPGPFGYAMGLSRPVLSGDGAWVAVGNYGELFVLSAATGEGRLRVLGGWEGVADLDFAPAGTNLAVLTRERLAIVDVRRSKLLHASPLHREFQVGCAVRYSADGKRIYVFAGDRLVAFDGATAAPLTGFALDVDSGAYGRVAIGKGGLLVHPDTNERMLVRQLPSTP